MKDPKTKCMIRTFLVYITVLAVGILILVKAVMVQTKEGDELRALADHVETRFDTLQASRGDILACDGSLLATDVPIFEVGIDPQVIDDTVFNNGIDQLSRQLAQMFPKRSAERWKKGLIEARANNKRYFLIDLNVTLGQYREMETFAILNKGNLKGGLTKSQPKFKRIHPYGSLAGRTIGYVNDDKLVGLESAYDSILRGQDGHRRQRHLHHGVWIPIEDDNNIEAINGNDIVTTLDIGIQDIAERALRNAITENKAEQGCAIVMEVATGDVKAIANLQRDKETNRCQELYNFALGVGIEPGSTFKIVTAAAALEEDVVNEDTNFFCAGFKQVEDKRIECANKNGHGAQTFFEGVKNSCNPVFMEVGMKMGADTFMRYYEAFGFRSKTGIELGGESSGIFYDKMNIVDVATSSFGQGFQVTPLQMVTAISAVVNGGERMKPHIVKEITNSDGIVKSYAPEVVNRVISSDTSKRMRNILEQVVADPNATGKNAYVKGYRIGGKTGTSEKLPRGSNKRIASFVGFAPANDPQLVCLVMLDEPQVENKYGGTIAAPVVGEILSESLDYMGVAKQYTEEEVEEIFADVPEFRGMSKAEATDKAKELGFTTMVKGSGDTIVDQLPTQDVRLEAGSVVILYTEDRKEDDMVAVPGLKGVSVRDAKYILNMRGLNFEISGAGHSEAGGSYAVSQTIAEGTMVQPGTVIGVAFRQQTND